MQQAYRHMGVSILSGYITTFGSGSALFFCEIVFFKKFGMTISLTVLFAFIIATFTFGAFMHAVGPQAKAVIKEL
jgi:predicted RND superfamily exporter protein